MADETYTSGAPGMDRVADDPEAARAEIEMTRARMSETIDDIEDALLRKKARIQDRMDVLAPVRERPIPSAAIALGAGLVLGLLTGGGGDEEDDRDLRLTRASRDEFDDELIAAEERAATWEARARRLMKVAREQEERLDGLANGRDGRWRHDEEDDEEMEISGLRDRVSDGVTGFLGTLARDVFAPRHR